MARVSIVDASVMGLLTRLLVFGASEGGFLWFVCMEWGKWECFLLAFLGVRKGGYSFGQGFAERSALDRGHRLRHFPSN